MDRRNFLKARTFLQVEIIVESEDLVIFTYYNDLFGHFQCGKRKSKTTSEYNRTPNKWKIWPQKPLLTTGKSYEESEKKGPNLKSANGSI